MITLPRFARQTQYELVRVSASRVARSQGGSGVPLNRTGDHFALEIDTGYLAALCGQELFADLMGGVGETVRAYMPQCGIEPGAPGTPLVKGAGQIGSSLDLDGFAPYFVVRKGWYVTVEHATRPSLHLVAAEAVADAAGELTLTFRPPLRQSPADNVSIEIVEPYIEGLIDGDLKQQMRGGSRAVTPDSFVIEEA